MAVDVGEWSDSCSCCYWYETWCTTELVWTLLWRE